MSQKVKNTRLKRWDEYTEDEQKRLNAHAYEKIMDAKNDAVRLQPFWGYLLFALEPAPLPTDFGTMSTDGYKIYYDPVGYIQDWSRREVLGVMIHEICHCAFGHLFRRGDRNSRIWNLATDYVINYIIVNYEKDFNLPAEPKFLYDNKYNDTMTAEMVYADLMKEKEEMLNGLMQQILDSPDIFDSACDGHSDNSISIDDATGGLVSSEDVIDRMKERNQQWWEDKVQTARTFAKSMGSMPGHIETLISSFLEPKLPWKQILFDFIMDSQKNEYRTLPSHKKYLWNKLYLPSLKGNALEIAIVLDTSGSISDLAAQQFLSEVKSITDSFDSYYIHFVQCDYSIQDYQVIDKYNNDNFPDKIYGRGGTSFIPPFDMFEEMSYEPPLLIYLTDLYGSFPVKPNYPVLWVAENVSNSNIKVPFGDVLNIDIHE